MVFAKPHTGVARKENNAINNIPSVLNQAERRTLELQRMLHNISEVHKGSVDSNLKFPGIDQSISVSDLLKEFAGPLADTDKIDASAKQIAAVNLSRYLSALENKREDSTILLAQMAENARKSESRFVNDKDLKDIGENKAFRDIVARFRKLEKIVGEDIPAAYAYTKGAPTKKLLETEERLVKHLQEMLLQNDFVRMRGALVDLIAARETLAYAYSAANKMSSRGEGIEAAKEMLRSYINEQRDNAASISQPRAPAITATTDQPTLEMPKVTSDVLHEPAALSVAGPAGAALLTAAKKEYHETINELYGEVSKRVKDLENKLNAGIKITDPGMSDTISKANESNLLLFAVVHTFSDKFKNALPQDELAAIGDLLLKSNQLFHNLSSSTGGTIKVSTINIGNAVRSHSNELHEKLMELHELREQVPDKYAKGTSEPSVYEEFIAFVNGEYKSKYPELMQELGRLGVDTESFMGEYVRHVFDISASLRSATRKAEGAQEEGTSHEESPAIFSP